MHVVLATVVAAATGFLVCLQSTSSARLEESPADQPADSIAAHIDSLRVEARYVDALASARDLLALRKSSSGSRLTLVDDAKRLVATLEFASALSDEVRKELAQADELEREIIAAYEAGSFSAGQESARRQLEIRRRLLGPKHAEIAESLDDLGDLTRRSGDYAAAEGPLRESLEMRRSILGESHRDVAKSLNNLGVLLQARGDHAQAESLLRKSMETFRAVHASDHPDIAESLDNLGDFLRARGHHASAESLYSESLEMRRRLFGEKHSSIATSLNNLAGAVRDRGDYAGAEPLYREGLEMYRSIYGERHPHVAAVLNNLGLLQLDSGNYPAAEPLFRESLAMRRSLLGSDHPNVGTSLNNLASILYYQGDYAQAEPLFRESLALARKRLGEEHADVGQSLNNLAALLYERGDYAGAEPLFREALAVHRKLYGEEHRSVVKSLHNLAGVLHSSGDTPAAEPFFRQSIEIGRKLLGDEHPEVVKTMHNLANMLRSRGDLEEAERLYRDVLAVRRKILSPDHPDLGRSLNDLALCLQKRGNQAEAESLFHEAIVLRRKVLGANHPALAANLEDLAHLHQAIGSHAKAEPLLLEAAEVYEKARLRAGAGLSRAGFKESPYSALAAAYLATEREDLAWPSVERDLGRALADLLLSAEQRHLSPEESSREDSLKSALGNSERALAAYRKAAAKDSTTEAAQRVEVERTRLLQAEVAWSAFQQEMVQKHPVTEGEPFPLERVQRALGRKSAILGWLDVKWGEDRGESRAYVIRKKGPVTWSKSMAWDAGAIPSEQAAALRRELTDSRGSAAAVERESRKVFDARLLPVAAALEGVDELIVVQYGPMSVLPVEALIDERGDSMGDRFRISYVTSGTIYAWLIDRSKKARKPGPALLLADPPFTSSNESSPIALASAPDAAPFRSAMAGNEEALSTMPRLPATRTEVRAMSSLAPASILLLGREASEQELVRLAQSSELAKFRTLHFATHALVDVERPENCCLLLSRADLPNALDAALAGERIYDGLLTTKEILGEWRLDADLVTLSACETGLGKQVRGEGTLGFAPAFLLAGARSLVASLWKVDDAATSLLMQRFYRNWWKKGMTKARALQEAKQWLREYTDESGRMPYSHPYFWSAFILIGDPR